MFTTHLGAVSATTPCDEPTRDWLEQVFADFASSRAASPTFLFRDPKFLDCFLAEGWSESVIEESAAICKYPALLYAQVQITTGKLENGVSLFAFV